jgi:hypothetical protein
LRKSCGLVAEAPEDAIVGRGVPIGADVVIIEVLHLLALNLVVLLNLARDIGQGIGIQVFEAHRILL